MTAPPLVPKRTRWTVCVLLFLATALNYLDRQTLGILAPLMRQDLGLDNESLGWLFSAFYYAYTFAQFAAGSVIDRTNLRWAFGLAVLVWSAAGAAAGLSVGFWSLLAFRVLLGFAESANWPSALRVVSRAMPPDERAMGNGLFTSGTSVAALVAPGLILGVAGWFGWRWAFAVVGAFGAAWFAAWIWYSGRADLAGIWRDAEPAPPAASGYRAVLGSGAFWRVFWVAVLVNPCLYFNVNWLPTYFTQERGLAAGRELGWILTLIYLGLDLGNLFCGAAVMGLVKRGVSASVAKTAVFAVATASMCASAAVPSLTTNGAMAALALTNFGIGAWIAMYLTMAQEVSHRHVSTAMGLLGGSGSLAGALLMWAAGRVTQQTGSFTIPLVAVSVGGLLAACAGAAVLRVRREG